MWKSSLPKGFTLMEVIVAVGVIAILSAATISVIGRGPHEGARDDRRESDLASIVSAISLYRNDNGTFPGCSGSAANCVASSMVGMAPYMPTVPSDPANSEGRRYIYQPHSSSGGSCAGTAASRCVRYELCAAGERVTAPASNCPTNCGGTFVCSIRLSEP